MAKLSIRKWAKICVALGGVAFSATAAQAGDPCACAPVSCCAPAQCCDGIYEEAGHTLAGELCRLTEECCSDCCDTECCETECCEVDSCDGCGCGTGCGFLSGLFGKHHTDLACDSCDLTDCCDSCDGCGAGGSGIEFGGWVQIGYHSDSTGLFNNQPDRVNFHQVWAYAEKVADGSNGLDFGGRVDFMYGIDSGDTQAFGNNPGEWDFQNGWDRGSDYGFAMPQLYAEVAYGDISVKVGHFYTLLGYEVVTAPDNFFYSHAYTMYNSEAFTHTGVLTTYSVSDTLTLYNGWTAGWDTGFDRFDGNGERGNSWLGGYSLAVTDDVTLTHIITAGDFGLNGDGFSQSIVVDVAMSDKFNYVFQSDIFDAEDRETIGINQYWLYSISDTLGVGARAEWWKADGDSVHAVTLGANVKPMDNVIVRPEVRHQWNPGANNEGIASEGDTIFGIDAIITF